MQIPVKPEGGDATMRVAKPTFLCPFQDESLSGRPAYSNRIEAKEPPCLLILERLSGGGGTNENKRRCFSIREGPEARHAGADAALVGCRQGV